jgi:Zn-dependent protease
MLSLVNLHNPLLWALLIGWIMSVVLHEFAHGLVAWWGGDHTIRDRGGLTLNPLQYIDPVMSILLPAVFLLMGGVPLPGGATFIRRDLLRNRAWESAVSLAGPAMNLLIFLLLCIPLHPRMGWINYQTPVAEWTTAQAFVAGMAFSQLLAVLLNLVPIPPLDGFGAIAPYLPRDWRITLTTPAYTWLFLIAYFMALENVPQLQWSMYRTIFRGLDAMGVPPLAAFQAFIRCLGQDG